MSERRDRAKRYHDAIAQVLINDWDPVDVQRVPEAQDEYDSYVGGIHSRLIRHAPRHELLDHIWLIETEYMGLRGNRQKAERVVDKLLKVRDELESV